MERNTSVRYPGGRSAIWGMVAYVTGFLISLALVSSRRSELYSKVAIVVESSSYPLTELLTEVHTPLWKWAGLAFYNAHFVDVVFRGVPEHRQVTTSIDLLAQAGSPFLLLFLVPPLFLIASGALTTRKATETTQLRFDFGGTGTSRFVFNGGIITLFGYLPFAILGAIIFLVDIPDNGVIQVDLLKSWVLVGIIYPFVFGGIGGYLRFRAL